MDKLLLSITWEVNPQVFLEFPYLRWYSLFWALGIYISLQVMVLIFKKEKKDLRVLDRLALAVILGLVLGARLGHVLFYDPQYYLSHPIEILPFRVEPHFEFTGFLGLASHGGVIGAIMALFVFNRKSKTGFYWALDRLIIAGSLLGAFIRVGNFFNSEIIGTPTDMPWAVVFTRIDLIPRHPSQLYEAMSYLVIFFILYSLWRSNKFNQSGFLTGIGLTLIFGQRILIEFFKEDQVAFEGDMLLNMGQILSIPIVIFGLFLMFSRLGNSRSVSNEPTQF
ncbi:MAG: prolipoprotein diacylglyceryl transferase [Bacteroidota bacterium]